ncbi:hypothetical protein G3N58_21145 [Paraburkholderia sp. Ac-20342]|uniref:hypothetical protein n=1 Tax=Paraburkholderia sp. Ac-20342 TaxID=2703889 RepID=UPI00197CFB9B|nr:hypothetical protein [Paraburkholderia sp. Ac-20342]MBN3849311.1 hypothetical protein [Paraburkholderia sp. Ac-20342]
MENELLSAPVRLSGKEVPGLAARVLGTALMPWGASGGAAEAIEFGEFTSGGRLSALAGQLYSFDAAMWRAPEIVAEYDDCAVGDARGGSALFFGAALADWLCAWSSQRGRVAVALRNVAHPGDLHAVPYWLARHGYAGVVVAGLPAGETAGGVLHATVFSAASAEGTGWRYAASHEPGAVPAAARSFLAALQHGTPSQATFRALLQGDDVLLADEPDVTWLGEADAVIVASPPQPLAVLAGDACAYTIDSTRFDALKARVRADGWTIPRAEWEQLMRFADRSLIRTSERSREGAG